MVRSRLNKTAKNGLTGGLLKGRYIVILLFIIGGLLLTVADPRIQTTGVLGTETQHTSAKRLRRIANRKSKPICGKPKPNHFQCFAYASTKDNGDLFTAQPAVSGGFGPAEFHTAYNMPCTPGGSVSSICSTPGSYGPQTVAIVDAGNIASGVENSVQAYNQQYGLPACTVANGCLTIVNQSGATSPLPSSQGFQWEVEIAMDVETVHMMCQTCKIVLVEATTNSFANMATAENTAASYNPVSISNSFGLEGTDVSSFDAAFTHPGIAVVVATGDLGADPSGISWPADIPSVIAAAGTSLSLNVDNSWASETVWLDSGGGCAPAYSAPSWQTSLAAWGANGCGSNRSYGDVSADANPSTGAAVYLAGTWYQTGGTSLSTPIIASAFALVGSVPTGATASSIPYGSFTSANFHDVTSGNDCTFGGQTHCTAAVGFDTPTGLGTPNGLGGFSPPPSQPTGLTATDIDQSHTSLSWTASTGNVNVNSYKIYRNNVLVGSSGSTSYTDSGLSPNVSYTYKVVAQDIVNNVSPASTTSSTTTYYKADINQDTHINLLDFSLLASKFGQSGGSLGRSDLNADSTVNLLDFSLLASVYGIE